MRTTLTLEPDVAALLRRALKQRGTTLKGVINDALRRGLAGPEGAPARLAYRIKPVHLGESRLPSLDNVAEALAIAEGEAYR
jgi:hypothetical protein